MIAHEQEAAERVVAARGDFLAFCPYASAHPFEVIIAADTPCGQIDTLDDTRLETAAALLLEVLERLKTQLGYLAFNLEIATPPLHDADAQGLLEHTDAMFRFMIRIMPRLYRFGGFELSSQMMINPVAPEELENLEESMAVLYD